MGEAEVIGNAQEEGGASSSNSKGVTFGAGEDAGEIMKDRKKKKGEGTKTLSFADGDEIPVARPHDDDMTQEITPSETRLAESAEKDKKDKKRKEREKG